MALILCWLDSYLLWVDSGFVFWRFCKDWIQLWGCSLVASKIFASLRWARVRYAYFSIDYMYGNFTSKWGVKIWFEVRCECYGCWNFALCMNTIWIYWWVDVCEMIGLQYQWFHWLLLAGDTVAWSSIQSMLELDLLIQKVWIECEEFGYQSLESNWMLFLALL